MSVVGIYVRVFFLVGLAGVAWFSLEQAKRVKADREAERLAAEQKAEEVLSSIPNLNAPEPPPPLDPSPYPTPSESPAPPPALLPGPGPMPGGTTFEVAGRVYDLRTLRPLAGVPIVFESRRVSYPVTSRGDGSYAVTLGGSSEGYSVVTKSPSHVSIVLHEDDVPYRKLSAADRNGMIESARADDIVSTRIGDLRTEGVVRRDLFLVPAP